MAVVIAHERLDLPEDVFLRVVEGLRYSALELERKLVGRAAVEILHLGAGAQEKIVAFIETLAVGIAEDFPLHELRGGVDAELELRDPKEALVVAQAAGAAFDIRLLHENALAVFGAKLVLVRKAPGDVFLLAPVNALALEALLEAGENVSIADEVSRLQHRGFRHHVLVGFFDRLRDRARGLPDLEADIPEGNNRAADDLFGFLVAGFLVLQEKDIDVAHGREFAPPVASEGHDAKPPGERLRCDFAHDALEEFADKNIHNVRTLAGDFAPPAAGFVPLVQALLLDLQKIFEQSNR